MQKQRQTFETMSEETPRKSKGDNVMSSTIAMHNDNVSKLNVTSKLDECANTLRSSAFNENKEGLGLD